MSHAKILIRALPNVEFVHGFPGIPADPDRPQATIRGAVEIRMGQQPVKAKSVKVELRKIETIPGGGRGEEFVDLVGQNPVTVWEAREGHDTLTNNDFPFNIRVPETIPPSVALERGAGIKYEVVGTLCTKGKKGLFRREASTLVSHSVPVVIDKHELHSTWPVYAQPESRRVVNKGLTLIVDRSHTCFSPGDRLSIAVTIKSDNLSPVVLRGFEFSLKETIIYRGGPQSQSKKNGPIVQTSVLGEQKLPFSMTLYGGTQHKAELGCVIPGNHTTSSVNAGRHIDIGYSLHIMASIDKANPVVMDLPLTITNWPRHVSADLIRRIGTAPNLTLKAPTSPKPLATTVVHSVESRPKYGPPPPPPSGGLPSLPNGSVLRRSVPPGALVSGPPGSPNLTQYATSMNPYAFQQNPYSTVVRQTSPQPNATPVPEAPIAADRDASETNTSGNPDEFGMTPQSSDVAATTPSRLGDRNDLGVTDPNQPTWGANNRSANSQLTSDLDALSQDTQGSDIRTSVVASPTSSTGRRTRGMSRTLKIVNANDDIPEEESSGRKQASPKPSGSSSPAPASPQTNQKPAPPSSTASSASPWPTAGDEKQRLYEAAKAKAQKVQAYAAAGEGSSQIQSPRPSNGHRVSPPPQASPTSIEETGGERPRTTSPSLSRPPWPTAEEEKQKLFERAQAKVRRTQGLVNTPSSSPSPATESVTRPSHNRKGSSNSSQDSSVNRGLAAYASTSVPTISAGAALYSHAMASINRSTSTMSTYTPPSTSTPRRYASYTGAGSAGSGSAAPPSTRQGEDPSALRYYEARNAVQRHQLAGGSIPESTPQEGPIPYDELFGRPTDPPSVPSAAAAASPEPHSPHLSEKAILRQAYEARDAEVAANNTRSASAIPPAVAAHRSSSVRTMTPPAGPPAGISEKEVMRRAFEARDAVIMRSGQTPPPVTVPLSSSSPGTPSVQDSPPVPEGPLLATQLAMSPVHYTRSARSTSISGGPSSSRAQPTSRTSPSEKEQMRLAFEARDRALAAQEAPAPPGYDMPPPPAPLPPVLGGSNGAPLSAAEEKAQLKARYATVDAGAGMHSPSSGNEVLMTPPAQAPGQPMRAPSHKSHRSDTSETFLRRDPSISAGKKRASQMIAPSPPPPLPPRPPAEYIEETKLEDRRNTLLKSMTLPPSDFSSSFDLGFDSFSTEPTPSEHRSS